jgi:Fungal pheromone mating factor STE2 GPCR
MHSNPGLPHDGRGGYLWTQNFSVPVYFDNEGQKFMNLTWSEMDYTATSIAQYTALYAICFGLVLMTAMQVIALTPSTKRGLPLYTFTLLAIAFEEVRLTCEVILFSRSGFGSMYWNITGDSETTQFAASTIAMLILCQVASCFAFLFASFCFFIQAKAVLSFLKITHSGWYTVIFTYLIGFGVFTFLWRIMYAVWSSVNNAGEGILAPLWMWYACDILYGVSIGSWSLVFSVQVALVLYRRANLGGTLQRTEALNILLLTGLESMILPRKFKLSKYDIGSSL